MVSSVCLILWVCIPAGDLCMNVMACDAVDEAWMWVDVLMSVGILAQVQWGCSYGRFARVWVVGICVHVQVINRCIPDSSAISSLEETHILHQAYDFRSNTSLPVK